VGFLGYTHLKTTPKNPHFYFNLILVCTLYATNNAIFYCFKAFKALSYWVFVLFYLFFPACPKNPLGWAFFFLKKKPGGFLNPETETCRNTRIVASVAWGRNPSANCQFIRSLRVGVKVMEFSLQCNPNVDRWQFWAAMSRITVCFCQFFSTCLFTHFKPRSPWKKMIWLTPACAIWCIKWQPRGWSCWLSISSSTMVAFSLVYVFLVCHSSASASALFENFCSTSSVATRFGCGKIFYDSFITNCP